jgi:hypothetical protein
MAHADEIVGIKAEKVQKHLHYAICKCKTHFLKEDFLDRINKIKKTSSAM